MKQYRFFRPYLLFTMLCSMSCCVLLTGCMSTLKALNPLSTADETSPEPVRPPIYSTSKDLWQRAAFRPNDIFNRYEFKLFASVKWQKRSDETTYVFENIKITTLDDPYAINLIHPQFNGKMACGWYCEYLDQPITVPIIGAYTMLDKAFTGQQSDLLNFYDSLKRLNERLLSLKPAYLTMMPMVIAKLAAMDKEFETLPHAVAFLNDYFDDIDLQGRYNSMPGVDGVAAVNQPQPTNEVIIDTIDTFADEDNDGLPQFLDSPNPDQALLASFEAATRKPHIAQVATGVATIPDTFTPLPAFEQEPTIPVGQPSGTDEPSLWSTLSTQNIEPGQFVCSYQDSYFGEVASINGQRVTVRLKGQARAVRDGLFVNVEAGTLFLPDADFSYLQSEDSRTFQRDQLAPCHLSAFN